MVNLLKETIDTLAENGKTPADVEWVGTRPGNVVGTWDEFGALADVDYDNGFGGEFISLDLAVVGSDWWLERHEYDGSEWWEFKQLPQRNTVSPLTVDNIRSR